MTTLRLGSTGPAVVALQQALSQAGYYLTADIDGAFGPVTRAAVETYQLAHSLDVDGVAGPLTLAELARGAPAPPTLPTGADPHAIPRPPAGWIVGVDTSAAQGILDVPALMAAGVAFLIAKATDGERSVDARWTISAAAAVRHGLPLGAYGVYEPAGVAGARDDAGRAARVRAQAQHFLDVTRDAGATLPPVLDFELATGPALHNLDAVIAAGCARKVVITSSISAIVDETIGYVLPILGELAYTANLNLDYVAPAPLHQELRVTASLRDRADRKLWLQAHGESNDGIFVRAEALFLTVDLTKFANDAS